ADRQHVHRRRRPLGALRRRRGRKERDLMATGADALMRTLVDAGIVTCFTNPGTSEMHFVAALDSTPEMRAVLALFEGVATGAAAGTGPAAGRVDRRRRGGREGAAWPRRQRAPDRRPRAARAGPAGRCAHRAGHGRAAVRRGLPGADRAWRGTAADRAAGLLRRADVGPAKGHQAPGPGRHE